MNRRIPLGRKKKRIIPQGSLSREVIRRKKHVRFRCIWMTLNVTLPKADGRLW